MVLSPKQRLKKELREQMYEGKISRSELLRLSKEYGVTQRDIQRESEELSRVPGTREYQATQTALARQAYTTDGGMSLDPRMSVNQSNNINYSPLKLGYTKEEVAFYNPKRKTVDDEIVRTTFAPGITKPGQLVTVTPQRLPTYDEFKKRTGRVEEYKPAQGQTFLPKRNEGKTEIVNNRYFITPKPQKRALSSYFPSFEGGIIQGERIKYTANQNTFGGRIQTGFGQGLQDFSYFGKGAQNVVSDPKSVALGIGIGAGIALLPASTATIATVGLAGLTVPAIGEEIGKVRAGKSIYESGGEFAATAGLGGLGYKGTQGIKTGIKNIKWDFKVKDLELKTNKNVFSDTQYKEPLIQIFNKGEQTNQRDLFGKELTTDFLKKARAEAYKEKFGAFEIEGERLLMVEQNKKFRSLQESLGKVPRQTQTKLFEPTKIIAEQPFIDYNKGTVGTIVKDVKVIDGKVFIEDFKLGKFVEYTGKEQGTLKTLMGRRGSIGGSRSILETVFDTNSNKIYKELPEISYQYKLKNTDFQTNFNTPLFKNQQPKFKPILMPRLSTKEDTVFDAYSKNKLFLGIENKPKSIGTSKIDIVEITLPKINNNFDFIRVQKPIQENIQKRKTRQEYAFLFNYKTPTPITPNIIKFSNSITTPTPGKTKLPTIPSFRLNFKTPKQKKQKTQKKSKKQTYGRTPTLYSAAFQKFGKIELGELSGLVNRPLLKFKGVKWKAKFPR